ncbi:dipeptide ABC transporter ATP-binding protein [Nesterenkonia lacusekhoensis]|uniref:Peptide/nickel transport system ATP-binding protein n=1 Tax=Nesterenkonia lacusekhoensis TaxID=150832 RepID=A0ABS4SZG1_9MICC|nr:ABC transporter ATP-binding protein [Nesterenkonia lacusekhoensis]MBP2317601.1 peptide/nickel transport system ATP-binding protein [Nesterenkonia lacusekhoensis]
MNDADERSAAGRTSTDLLEISGLRIGTSSTGLVHGVDLTIGRGERVGLIGESGSGKSLTLLAAMGLLPENLQASGSVGLEGEGELIGAQERRLAAVRGSRISMVFQEPMTALNPLMRVGEQVAETIRIHRGGAGEQLHHRVLELLDSVRIPEPARAARAYPHELSGGQRQRVMLALAMANRPDLLLADEPTTALDVTVQRQVLDIMADQVRQTGSSLLFVTHDLGVVASLCDRVLIMREGQIVESGSTEEVFRAPQHPYTRGLLAASALETDPRTGRLRTIGAGAGEQPASGSASDPVPELGRAPGPGSAPRHEPVPEPVRRRHSLGPHEALSGARPQIFNQTDEAPLLAARDLTRTYGRTGPLGGRRQVQALRGVSFDVRAGQRFGIVGESGCGKSTLLRMLTGLEGDGSGSVTVGGQEVLGRKERHLRWLRDTAQIVFQDPMGSLDPRMRIGDVVAEPLRGVAREERRSRVTAMLEDVGLPGAAAERYPHEFSGGQRQRIAIARALITRPKILVADEAVSALDVSVRAQVLNLLDDLVRDYDLTMLFVSHDLHVVRHACDTVAVMQEGRIVECGPAEALFAEPQHSYTASLMDSVPPVAG